jgi:hypothetical protein
MLQTAQYKTYGAHDEEKERLLSELGKMIPGTEEYVKAARAYDEYLVDKCGTAFMSSFAWYWFNNEKLQLNDEGTVRYVYNMYWEDPENHPEK